MQRETDDFAIDGEGEFGPQATILDEAVVNPGATAIKFPQDCTNRGAWHIKVRRSSAHSAEERRDNYGRHA